MTEPPFGAAEPGPPHQPPPYQAPYPPGGGFPPPYYPPDPMAPFGRHPRTGEPLSDKSKLVAGLLQLLGLAGILGIGRMYLGQIGFGVAQLLIGLFGGLVIGFLTCGVGFLLPAVWGIVDAVLIFTDKVRDPLGRPLRDGA